MSRAMRRWGPDGIFTRSDETAVLGMAHLSVTPESVYESMPRKDEESGALFTTAARLDNRDELCEDFGIPAPERPTVSDGRLALSAFRKWGEDAPAHLFGDWTLAAWDGRRHRLFLAKDQLGNTGLFYYYRPPVFAFASDPEALFALNVIDRKINEKYIASYLTFVSLANKDDTCWMDISTLLSGHALTVTPEGKQTRRYWEFEKVPAVEGKKDDEYVAGFLEFYRAAVKARLRSRYPIGSTLSSGLDSSSVTALAAQALKEHEQGLTAFTSVPLFPAAHLVPKSLADEWPLARTVSLRYDNIEHVAIDAAAITPLAGIERAVANAHCPQHAAVNQFWIMAFLDAARERGIRVILTGQLGNGSISWSGGRDRIIGLFAAGKWDEGMRAMAQWKKRHGRSWIRTLAEHLGRPLLRPYWKQMPRLWKPATPPWGSDSAIHPAFAARIGLRKAMKTADHMGRLNRRIDPFEERRLVLVRNGTYVGSIWHVTGAAFGMEVRDPTADIRLIEYCRSVPADQDTFAGGRRMLIRRAMEGILSPEVQWNTVRGKQAADVALRLVRHPAEMDALLARFDAHPEASRYLDLDLMRRVWGELQAEVNIRTKRRTETLLLRGIMCGCFIEDAGRLGRSSRDEK